jgi:hypothetical protein
MNEENQKTDISQIANMSEEQLKTYMSTSPDREEVNRYLNNLYMTINNSFGMFQGYMITSLAQAITEELAEKNITIDKEAFIKRFFTINQDLMKQALESINAEEEEVSQIRDNKSSSREVDVSMF